MFSRLLLASAFAAGLAFAQGMGGMGGSGGSKGGGSDTGAMGDSGMSGGMPRAQRQSKLDLVADKLHLSKEQKDQFTTIMSAAQEEAAPLREQLGQGRNAITGALIQGKSGDELNKMMEQFTALLVQRASVEAKAYGKLYAILEAKQQAKAGQVFADQMDGILDSRGGGRGGRGR